MLAPVAAGVIRGIIYAGTLALGGASGGIDIIAVLIRKTPAKIRLKKDNIIAEDYIRLNIHDFLLKCVEGHCNVMVSGETGSGKTEFVKFLAANTLENEISFAFSISPFEIISISSINSSKSIS